MPARSSQFPNHYERSVLQRLRLGNELPATKLLSPAGRATIKKLLEKGWIDHGSSIELYRITRAGDNALRAELPEYRRN